jgi:F420-non-reducing hydrogenase small subunit
MANKRKMAICWLGGCGGCDEAIVDINEDILAIVDSFDLVLWPVALDHKYRDIEAMEDGAIALSLVNGSVRNSEHEEVAHLLRKKSQLVVAFGACACFGGTPGMANLRGKEDIFQWVYKDAPTVVNPDRNMPQPLTVERGNQLTLPEFYDQVYPLGQVIDVDYYLPGCPPPPDRIRSMGRRVITGDLPPKGSTLTPTLALCDRCARNTTKPDRIAIEHVKRIHEVEADPEKCFLGQGVVCMGPATRAGCGESCININMPCRGCFGPVGGVEDMGAKYLSAFATLIKGKTEEERRKVAGELPDPVGYFYRFTTASSLLRKKRDMSKKA